MNAYDLLAEIGVGSVARDARRHVRGHESLTARQLTAPEVRRGPMVEAERTGLSRRHGANPRALTTAIAATRVAIGSTLVRLGWRVQRATGADAASGSAVPAGRFVASR